MPKRGEVVVIDASFREIFISSGAHRQVVLSDGSTRFKHIRIKRFSLPPKRSLGNQKTPERTTIEIPLYFCSRQFVGQFARVMCVAVSGSAESVR
jgi:hypothetical protein